MARGAFRSNGGFTAEEVAELKDSFNTYDQDMSGEIDGSETIRLFESEFPSISNDPFRRPQLLQLLRDADEDGNGSLNFPDFLRIMRQLRDMQDQMRLSKELDAVNSTKFTPPEVQEFRELFVAAGHGLKELDFNMVRELLKGIVPMGAKNIQELRQKFIKMAAKQCGVVGDVDLLDFPEFLWLMRELIATNFAGMNGKAEQVAASGGDD
jgi:Ca2+-binding EF-hand superfamily protein